MNMCFVIILGVCSVIGFFCVLDMYIKNDLMSTWHCFFSGHKCKEVNHPFGKYHCVRCNQLLEACKLKR